MKDAITYANEAGFFAFNVIGWKSEFERLIASIRAEYEAPLKLAEEALDMYCEHGAILRPFVTLAAIREALAEPDWYEEAMRLGGLNAKHVGELKQLRAEPVKQEPVAVVDETAPGLVNWTVWKVPEEGTKLYAAPVDAKAIRAEALEEAAKVCEEVAKHYITNHKEQEQVWLLAATSDCAAAIRAIGETK